MYLKGQFIGKWCVLKQSGNAYEVSNGKAVYRVAMEDMEKKQFTKGELMMNLPQPDAPVSGGDAVVTKKKKVTTKKKKTTVKKK